MVTDFHKVVWLGLFTNWPGDRGSVPSQVIPKTQKMVLDSALLNSQLYKVMIKCKVEQSSYILVLKLLKKKPLGRLQRKSPTLL